MNHVTFRHWLSRWPRVGDLTIMIATIRTPTGRLFEVAYHERATAEGWDGLSLTEFTEAEEILTTCWFQDRREDDVFASEMFAALAGLYPYQVSETVPAEDAR
jgi:hypothetical protein